MDAIQPDEPTGIDTRSFVSVTREELETIREGVGQHCPCCGDSHASTEDENRARAVLDRLLE